MTGVPWDDRGLLLGDGLFETVLAVDGTLVMMDAHVRRMQSGAAALGLPPPTARSLRAAAVTALGDAALGAGRAAVRLTLTAGSGGRGLDRPATPQPRLLATAAPSPRPQGALSLAVAEVRRNDASPASRWKTLAYLDQVLARRQAQAAGADDAAMLNTRGQVACCAAANLFWIDRARLFTPSLECGVLEGVMRGQVIAAARAAGVEVVEAAMGLDALRGAQAAFATSSLAGVRPISRLDGRAYAPCVLVDRLAAAVAAVS